MNRRRGIKAKPARKSAGELQSGAGCQKNFTLCEGEEVFFLDIPFYRTRPWNPKEFQSSSSPIFLTGCKRPYQNEAYPDFRFASLHTTSFSGLDPSHFRKELLCRLSA